MRKVIHSDDAPDVNGLPLSQAILDDAKYHLEISGQIGVDSRTGKIEGDIATQTEQTLVNIKGILASVGWGFGNIVKVRIFLADMADYQAMNEVYAKKFPSDPPARVALAVKELPLGALVEIECVAAGDEVSS